MHSAKRCHFHCGPILLPAFFLVGTMFSTPAFCQAPQEPRMPLGSMFEADRDKMAVEIVAVANRVANARRYFETDKGLIKITGAFDVEKKVFQFDMEERFGPDAGYDELSDMHRAIESAIEPLTSRIEDFYAVYWTYGGKDIEHWMPRPKSQRGILRGTTSVHTGALATIPVVVAAGHGYYYHQNEKTWKPHRDPINGVLEDTITPVLAAELVRYLGVNKISAEELRPTLFEPPHEPSGLPWWHIGARYRLEISLPDNPEIWHSLPTSTDGSRDRREDIKSRPLYANHVQSPAIIHVHTNADDKVNTSGARVYVAPGRLEDVKLARLALCGMREAIHTVERFKSFSVSTEPHPATDNAENNLANMPSIIVETAFHTNASDAELLKDPEFQKLSMMGVAKGYRLYTEGKSCDPFAVAEIASVEAFVGQQVNQPVALSGHPVFPVDLAYRPSRCRREPCTAERKVVFDQAGIDAFRVPYFCAADDVSKGPIDFTVWAKDTWAVETEPVIYRLTCKARGI
ncbi:hypothetical protein ACVWWJ_004027 [Luteibacter sp. HA06]